MPEGTPTSVPLKRGAIKRRENEDGSYRWYGEYHVPPAFGGGGMLTLDWNSRMRTSSGA